MVPAVIAIVSAIWAVKSKREAAEASTRAEAAADRSAESQEQLAAALRSIEQMQQEDRVVRWQVERVTSGVYALRNLGAVAAYDVKIENRGSIGAILTPWRGGPVEIEGGLAKKFKVEYRGPTGGTEILVTWAANLDGVVLEVDEPT